jgi:CRP-like cAMP-binding protein
MIAIMSGTFERLFADAGLRDFAPGEALFRAGDAVVSMILLRSGHAELVRHTGHGLRGCESFTDLRRRSGVVLPGLIRW